MACWVSADKSANSLMEIPLYVICWFSLVVLNVFLSLIFVSLINICVSVFLLGFILFRTLCASWTWVSVSFPGLWKFLFITSSTVSSVPFSLSSSATPITQILVHLLLSQRSLRLSSFFLYFFSVLWQNISTSLSSSWLIRFSALFIRLLIPYSIFILVILLLNCFFVKSSNSLLNISCNFLVYPSIPFSRSWIICTIITLSYFSVRLLICISLSCSSDVLSCSFIWNVFLCHIILSNFLCLWSPFHRL